MQRRTFFSGILNETRRELAVRYLQQFEPVDDEHVAQLTGYSALSSFTRWFASEIRGVFRDGGASSCASGTRSIFPLLPTGASRRWRWRRPSAKR